MLRLSWKLFGWSVAGIVVSAALVYLAYDRSQPFLLDKYVSTPRVVRQQKTELMEVKTEDGKKVKAFVPVPDVKIVNEETKQTVKYEPTPEQRLRLSIITWLGVALLIFFVLLTFVWFSYFFRKEGKPPKNVDDLLKNLVVGMVGVLVGFAGSPSGDSKVVTDPTAVSKPSTKPKER